MESELKVFCQWHECRAHATHRLDVAPRNFAFAYKEEPNNLDFCDVHANEVGGSYLDISESIPVQMPQSVTFR